MLDPQTKPMTPGTAINLGRHKETEAEYRGNPAINNSGLNTFLWNEWWYQQVHVLKTIQPKDRPAYVFGRGLHCVVLEPDEYVKRFDHIDFGRTSKAFKEFAEAQKAKGKDALTTDEHKTILDMAEAIKANTAATSLIDACDTEVVFRHMCNGNLARQCRVDGVTPFGDVIDIKSCASIEDFRYHFRRFGYHRQAQWYRKLVSAVTNQPVEFTFIAVEKEAPFRCELFRLDQESCGMADREIEDAMIRLEACLKENKWRRNVEEVQMISLSRRSEYAA
jgi:hypothetical protein